MQDGRPTKFDVREIKAEARELATEFMAYVESCRGGVDELAPYYEEMYQMAIGQRVPMHRWVGRTGVPAAGGADHSPTHSGARS